MNNGELYKQLYTLLEENVFFGDRLEERQFVSLLVPGQYVSTGLKKTSLSDQFNLFSLTDKTIDSTFLWRPLISTISGLYGEIVEFAALPDKKVDQALIDKLSKELNSWQKDYDRYQQFYDDADSAWRKAVSQENADENLIIELAKKRNKALRNWENPSMGRRKMYDTTLGELNQHLAGNPRTFWETEVRQRFEDRKVASPHGDFYDTVVDPHPSDWAAAGWEKQSLSIKDVWTREYSKSTSFSAGGGASWGMWSVGGSYARSTQETQEQSKVSDINIEFELLRVNITRPWLNQNILGRRFWAWKKTHDNLLITDGGSPPTQRPLGPRGMPVLTTVFFVVRNVKITAKWSEEDKKYWAEQIQAKVNFGWGPFSCSGSYSESTTEKTYTGSFDGVSISIEQPQILALGGILPPRCPDPDPSLPWSTKVGEEPWLSPALSAVDAALLDEARQAQLYDTIRERMRKEFMASAEEEFEKKSIKILIK